MKCRYPGNKDAIKQLTTHLKGFLHTVPGDNSRILIKLCHTGQTDQYMLGYIQKDKGQTHFQVCEAAVLLCVLLTLLHAIGLPHCSTLLFFAAFHQWHFARCSTKCSRGLLDYADRFNRELQAHHQIQHVEGHVSVVCQIFEASGPQF